jgi:hypothetical protein
VKRDWDVIRDVLLEVEDLSEFERGAAWYGPGREDVEIDDTKHAHAILLWEAGYLKGVDGETLAGPLLLAPNLTWEGRDLLDTLRSKPVWERIKTTAKEKGLELTFDAVKALGKAALDYVIKQGGG